MDYDLALKLWGRYRLNQAGYTNFDLDSVTVDMYAEDGWNCCGGSNPDCYCSMVESASAGVEISAKMGKIRRSLRIESYEFNFSEILQEILEVSEGLA